MFGLLIVEDEPIVRQGIQHLIPYEQFQIDHVFVASDGVEAWDIFQKENIDIVLTDINMPQMDGITLSKLIKEYKQQTRIIFLTGYNMFDYALKALKLGADDYLLKPFSKSDIEIILKKTVSKLKEVAQQKELQQLIEDGPTSKIEKQIEQHLADQNFSRDMLADILGFSPNYLSKLMKEHLGMSFQNYLIARRIAKAKLLLLTTSLKNYEIAEAVGFDDMNYFCHRFKLEVGMTPREFKKEKNYEK